MTGSEEKQWQYLTTRLLTKMVRIKKVPLIPEQRWSGEEAEGRWLCDHEPDRAEQSIFRGLIKKKVKSKDLAVFCKQFSAVIRAGVTIISALELMGDQIEKQNTAESSYGCKDIC